MMRKLATFFVFITALTMAVMASSQLIEVPIDLPVLPSTSESAEMINEIPKIWFVELFSPPAVDGTSMKTLKKEKDEFRAAAAKAGLKYTERFAFKTLWNGLSIKIEPSELGTLSRIAGVKALYPVSKVSLSDLLPSGIPQLEYALAMTGADIAQSELGYTGAGIRVAVMDSGIDYDHPDLGGCFGPGCRVETGYDFVGDAFDGTIYNPPVPDNDPDDCMGHGTHVAGIIGASAAGPDGVTGVAPDITFGAYRVFGCTGFTWTDIMIAAMERALADDMDILNMSIGSSFGWPKSPLAKASDRLVNKGMVVVASIGNDGTLGTYSCKSPGVGKKVIGVASYENTFPHPTGGLISSFSSYGLAPDLTLKPDIGAPGGNIYSTFPLELGGYATRSGTSMSSPHVAGAVALLLQAKPKTPSQVVCDILQNSADPALWSLAPYHGFLDHVHRQGAGMLDIDDAILATIRIKPGKLSLGESEAGPSTHMLTIENNGSSTVTYDLSYVTAVATTGTWGWDLGFWLTDEKVSFSTNSLTVPADATISVDVTVDPPTGPDLGQYGGYIVFTPQEGGQVYRVPYAGFVGDYQSLPVLTANPFLPWLRPSFDGDYTFSMEYGDILDICVNIAHQARKLRMKIIDAKSGKNFGRAFDINYMPRNSDIDYFFHFLWDGLTMKGKKVIEVPDGQYVIVLSVQKALGEDDNPAHWETWTSEEFTIKRPYSESATKKSNSTNLLFIQPQILLNNSNIDPLNIGFGSAGSSQIYDYNPM